jgi:hypothetical protein
MGRKHKEVSVFSASAIPISLHSIYDTTTSVMDQGTQILRANKALTDAFDNLKKALTNNGLPVSDSLQNLESDEVDAAKAIHDIETMIDRHLASKAAAGKGKTNPQKAADAVGRACRSAYPFARLIITIFKSGAQVLRLHVTSADWIDTGSEPLWGTL